MGPPNQMLQDGQGQANSGVQAFSTDSGQPMAPVQQDMSGGSELYKPQADGTQDASRKAEAASAVQDIVSLKLAQAQKAVESTKAFHAVAPEPKVADPDRDRRRRSKWDGGE